MILELYLELEEKSDLAGDTHECQFRLGDYLIPPPKHHEGST
jgi:hypothetical protein